MCTSAPGTSVLSSTAGTTSIPASRPDRIAASTLSVESWSVTARTPTPATHADDAVARTGHPHVGDVGGALRQDAFVGGLDVGMRTDQRADLPVQVPAPRHLPRGGLGVKVHDDQRGRLPQLFHPVLGRMNVVWQ